MFYRGNRKHGNLGEGISIGNGSNLIDANSHNPNLTNDRNNFQNNYYYCGVDCNDDRDNDYEDNGWCVIGGNGLVDVGNVADYVYTMRIFICMRVSRLFVLWYSTYSVAERSSI